MSSIWIAAFVALATLTLVTALATLGTLRRVTIALERAEERLLGLGESVGPGGLAPGTFAPEFIAQDQRGEPFTSAELRQENSILLFLSADCAPCRALADELRKKPAPPLSARLIVVIDQSTEAHALVERVEATVVYQRGRAVAQAFESRATPHAFVVDVTGAIVASSTPNTLAALRALTAPLEREEVTARQGNRNLLRV